MTKIKLCGLMRPCDIEAANKLMPEYIGFVFAPGSRRYVTKRQAAALKELLSPGITAVGVFVDEKPEIIAGLLREGIIDMAQLHGSEDAAYIRALRALTDRPLIQAFRMGGEAGAAAEKCVTAAEENMTAAGGRAVAAEESTAAAEKRAASEESTAAAEKRVASEKCVTAAESSTADAILLDSGAGCGTAFCWELAKKVRRAYFLAGGLNPENVGDAVRLLAPAAVDVSSGIETDGHKDAEKMAAFVAAVREEGRSGSRPKSSL